MMRRTTIALALAGILGASPVSLAESYQKEDVELSDLLGGDSSLTNESSNTNRSGRLEMEKAYRKTESLIEDSKLDLAYTHLRLARRIASRNNLDASGCERGVMEEAYGKVADQAWYGKRDAHNYLKLARSIASRNNFDSTGSERLLMGRIYNEVENQTRVENVDLARNYLRLARSIAYRNNFDIDRLEMGLMEKVYDQAELQIDVGQCNQAGKTLTFAREIGRRSRFDTRRSEQEIKNTIQREVEFQREYGNHDKVNCLLRL